MQMGKNMGMRLMDESIVELLEAGKITLNAAIANAENQALLQRFMPKGTKIPAAS